MKVIPFIGALSLLLMPCPPLRAEPWIEDALTGEELMQLLRQAPPNSWGGFEPGWGVLELVDFSGSAFTLGDVGMFSWDVGMFTWDVVKITVIGPGEDGDGIPKEWEELHWLNPNNPADAAYDFDDDGLSNLEEYRFHSDPRLADTDGGGASDGEEWVVGTAAVRVTDALLAQMTDNDEEDTLNGSVISMFHTAPSLFDGGYTFEGAEDVYISDREDESQSTAGTSQDFDPMLIADILSGIAAPGDPYSAGDDANVVGIVAELKDLGLWTVVQGIGRDEIDFGTMLRREFTGASGRQNGQFSGLTRGFELAFQGDRLPLFAVESDAAEEESSSVDRRRTVDQADAEQRLVTGSAGNANGEVRSVRPAAGSDAIRARGRFGGSGDTATMGDGAGASRIESAAVTRPQSRSVHVSATLKGVASSGGPKASGSEARGNSSPSHYAGVRESDGVHRKSAVAVQIGRADNSTSSPLSPKTGTFAVSLLAGLGWLSRRLLGVIVP